MRLEQVQSARNSSFKRYAVYRRLVHSKEPFQFRVRLLVGTDFFFSLKEEIANTHIDVSFSQGCIPRRPAPDLIEHMVAHGNHMVTVKDNDL